MPRKRVTSQVDGKSVTDMVDGTQTPVALEKESLLFEVELASIRPNPWQPRHSDATSESVAELAENIVEMGGLLQPPLGRRNRQEQTVELAFGHRRVAALRLLVEQSRWPSGSVSMRLMELDDRAMALTALAENQQRRQLTPLEEYRAYRKALDTAPGLTLTDLARSLGLNRSTLSNDLRILQLPGVVLDRVESGELSGHAAREFLCLQGQDHAHTDFMERVVREISATHLGSAPDWRVENVRRLIRGLVQGSAVSQWRRLDGGNGQSPAAGAGFFGGSHSASPSFDTAAFKKEFAEKVHLIPWEKHGLAWTCATDEWKKRQDAATASARKAAAAEEGAPAAATPDLQDILATDPVARRVLGDVSPETSVERALSAMGPAQPPAADAEPRAQGEGKLLAHLRRFVDSHPNPDSWTTLLSPVDNLHHSLGLSEYGVNLAEAAGVVVSFLDDLKGRLAIQKELAVPVLTAEQREALGTRGRLLEAKAVKGFCRPLDPRDYEGPPFFFDDLPECLERCTWGAVYVKGSYTGTPRLRCANEECWNKKLATGKEAALQRLEDHKELEAREEEKRSLEVMARGIPDDFLRQVAAGLLVAHGEFRGRRPAWARDGRHREFQYWPYALLRTRQLLGLREGDSFPGVAALAALQQAPEPVAAQVAALLLVYTLVPTAAVEGGV